MSRDDRERASVVELVDSVWPGWPLPRPGQASDKEERGRVVVVAGGPEMPGAAVLSGIAALRAGAGKLVIATAMSVAATVALAVPEARVIVLAGVFAGLLARGAEPPQAAAWGGALLARAGETIALRSGPLGYLARELSGEIPRLTQHLGR